MMIGFSLEGEPRGDGIPPQHGEMLDVVTTELLLGDEGSAQERGASLRRRMTRRGTRVIIVNEAFAKKYWPGRIALGKRISAGYNSDSLRAVIGVVGDVHRMALDKDAAPAMYLAYHQASYPGMTLLVRTRDNADQCSSAR